MRRWSEVAERVAATTRTSEKTSLLAEYLRSLDRDAPQSPAPPEAPSPQDDTKPADHPDLPIAAVFLTGRPFPEADQRATGLGWAAISATVSRVSGAPAGALGEAYDRSSDLGQAVHDVFLRWGRAPDPLLGPSLLDVAETYAAIEVASGPARKADVFSQLLERCDPLTAKYVVKVLTGDLRIGLREGLLEAAIGRAFDRPLEDVKWAGMLTGDVGRTARLAVADRLDDAQLTLFHPLKFMLASPAEDSAEILARLGPTVWVEDKYDGIRAQLHRASSTARLYSRDLHDVSDQFPEIVAAAAELDWDGVLDGEILAYRDGQVLPFLALQTRLGRKRPSNEIQAEVPVIYVAFDVLALAQRGGAMETAAEVAREEVGDARAVVEPAEAADFEPAAAVDAASEVGAPAGEAGDGDRIGQLVDGVTLVPPMVEPLLRTPLRERRWSLEALRLPLADEGGRFALSHLVTASSVDELERIFEEARARRNEGLMVKDPDSGYSPGRRGLGWLKMKKALATLDCVVVGVEVGHGKRHGVLSDYTFAVRDDSSGRLVTIGKAYSGLTDAEIAEMTAWFEAHTIRQLGRFRVVEPTVVVEVAFDVIMRSTRHQSGFALRFPRIVALRTDKSPAEIDTLENVETLYQGLQQGAEHLVTAGARR